MNEIRLFTEPEAIGFDVYTLTTFFWPGIHIIQEKDSTVYQEGLQDSLKVTLIGGALTVEITGGAVFLCNKLLTAKVLTQEEGLEFKYEFQLQLYRLFSEYTGRSLPWGNLTGIRPTKLIMQKLKETGSREQAFSEMHERHLISREKFELGADIAVREDKLLEPLRGGDGYSLYIGIPFCPSTCLYCSFTSYPIFKYREKVELYLEALKKELEFTAEIMKGKRLDTIYIGGGTPSSLSDVQLEILFENIVNSLDLSHLREFTFEAGRPDSITREKLLTAGKYPVTRISVNPQTMNEKTLKIIGRNHSPRQTIEAFYAAREAGFSNINMDMILGLPGEDLKEVEYTLSEIERLSPESLTVHSLAIKRASRLREWLEEHEAEGRMDFDRAMDMCVKRAADMQLNPYYLYRQKNMGGNLENTGFAKEGRYGLYNVLIMEEVQSIIACGAGTVSKRVYGDGRIERCDTVKDVGLYIEKIDEMIERKKCLFCR